VSTVLYIVICVLVAGFFSGSETGAYRLSRVRLRHQAESGSLMARMLRRVVSNMERFVCLTLIGTNTSVYAATGLLASVLAVHFKGARWGKFAGTMVLAPVMLIFAELLPKSVFQVWPNRLMRAVGPVLRVLDIGFRPLTMLLYSVVCLLRRLFRGSDETRQISGSADHFDLLLTEGRDEGVITAQQDLMVRNIMRLGKRRVASAMIPLGKVRMLPAEIAGADAVAEIGRHDHPRLPLYSNRREDIAGVLVVLEYLSAGADRPAKEYMYRPVFLDANLALDRGFKRLQEAGQVMGVVLNEKGRAVGIITMGDLLQEIFASVGDS